LLSKGIRRQIKDELLKRSLGEKKEIVRVTFFKA
jgi:hypothetical protein